ncbi:MAG: phage replisome organizer N-terminal domain-containing protein [bacterium]
MANNTWLRLYTDITRDRKLRRLSPTARWIWVTLLCMAKESPEPGKLLLSKNVPVTVEDIVDEAGISEKDVPDPASYVQEVLCNFKELDMIKEEDGVLVITNWSKRQFETDDIGQYLRDYRQRKQTSPSIQNENVTDDKRMINKCKTDDKQMINECKTNDKRMINGCKTNHLSSVLPDTDTESDTDTDNIKNPPSSSEDGAPTHSPKKAKAKKSQKSFMDHSAVNVYREVMCLTPKPPLRELIAQTVGSEPDALDRWKKACIEWLAHSWNPRNIAGLLDFFQNNGNKVPKMGKAAAAYMALAEKYEKEGG